jgi:hypothetical protein
MALPQEEQFDAFDVDITSREFWFPNIYKPWTLGDVSKFGVVIAYAPIAEMTAGLSLILQASKEAIPVATVRVASSPTPEVIPVGPYWTRGLVYLDELRRALEEFDARNMPRDRVFPGRDLRLTLRPFFYRRRIGPDVREGHGLALLRVMVRMDQRGIHEYLGSEG